MLTIEDFDSLETGDHIEAMPMFAGVTDEPVVLQTAASPRAATARRSRSRISG